MTTTCYKGWDELQQNNKQDKTEVKTGMCTIITQDRRQSKTLLTTTNADQK